MPWSCLVCVRVHVWFTVTSDGPLQLFVILEGTSTTCRLASKFMIVRFMMVVVVTLSCS